MDLATLAATELPLRCAANDGYNQCAAGCWCRTRAASSRAALRAPASGLGLDPAALVQRWAVMLCRTGRIRHSRCYVHFARGVTFLSCADNVLRSWKPSPPTACWIKCAKKPRTSEFNYDREYRWRETPLFLVLRLLVRPLLVFASVALVIGFVASRTDVKPYRTPFFSASSSVTRCHVSCLADDGRIVAGITGQLVTAAARIYGKTAFPARRPLLSPAALLVRAGGHSAHSAGRPPLHLQASVSGTYDVRAFITTLVLGASFYGAFFAKVLIVLHERGAPWALPMAGGALVAILTVLWLTSAFWLFDASEVSL